MKHTHRSSYGSTAHRRPVMSAGSSRYNNKQRGNRMSRWISRLLRLGLLLVAFAVVVAAVLWLGQLVFKQFESWMAPAMPKLTAETVLVDANHRLTSKQYTQLQQQLRDANASDGIHRLVVINNRSPLPDVKTAEQLWPDDPLQHLAPSLLKPMGPRLLVLWINPTANPYQGAVRVIPSQDLQPLLTSRPTSSFGSEIPLFTPNRLEPTRWNALTQWYFPLLLGTESKFDALSTMIKAGTTF